ncbi:hypothetical protein SS50377_27077 [Spironucleus salmonicida]|uniref:Cysteine-rich protein n=1 Tax=Spironucleus salmonicida TaxID=348837 RepID=V6M411_9EUKA|nr:hypothetical protein SS50377_27077 [Spironucleus salmonicida]|eukprot:EST48059.1 Hypothetical protein SS50377_11826 [Spironucleus salmonicida]
MCNNVVCHKIFPRFEYLRSIFIVFIIYQWILLQTGSKHTDPCMICSKIQTQTCKYGGAIYSLTYNTSQYYFLNQVANPNTLSCVTPQVGNNICSQQQTSQMCFDNYFCSGNQNDTCQSRVSIYEGQKCKYDKLCFENCLFCANQTFLSYVTGFTLENSIHAPYMQRCPTGYFSPSGKPESPTCQPCLVENEQQRNYAGQKHWQSYNSLNKSCQTSRNSLSLINGIYVIQPNRNAIKYCPIEQY